MSKHLLLKKAFVYPLPKEDVELSDCYYDDKAGYWKFKENSEPVIFSDNFIEPRTKKCDRETGEDQKGE